MKSLVIGGTGPSGPYIVEGLLDRGHEVTILHGGFHEVEFSQPVEHIHADPHFAETLEEALGERKFDLVVCTYGRTRIASEVMKGRTERFIMTGGGAYANPSDPRWGPLGASPVVVEEGPMQDDPEGPRFGYMMWLTEQKVLEAHQAGFYNVTILRYPAIYGPRQPADSDWSIVRRILDGRRQFIIADGGLKIVTRSFGLNAAQAVLLAVDKPGESAGQVYNVGDDTQCTTRQRIELMAKTLDHQWELVDMPQHLAKAGRSLWGGQGHRIFDTTKIRTQLGYKDVVPATEAIPLAVRWLVEHRPEPGGELENQLGDPFDYAAEDELIRVYQEGTEKVAKIYYPQVEPAHMYRHPTRPGEGWSRPGARGGY